MLTLVILKMGIAYNIKGKINCTLGDEVVPHGICVNSSCVTVPIQPGR